MSESELSTRGPVVTPARLIAAVCVIVPFVAVLWVPIFDKDKPEVAGFPFFFWWQLLWVAVTAALMGLAYFVVRREELARKAVAVTALQETPGTAVAETSEEQPEEEPEEGDSE
ncbi:hypothetical protein ABH935_007853 [Catenulispora sp. GAS73]|uniref:DUF3311 domain-containing protein n=1 Tax=Catenulispora sp. GAS73 TaxID=3156269 RepID=UPI003519B721